MRRLLVGIVIALVSTTVVSHGQAPPEILPIGDSDSTGIWFVELSSAPTIEGTSRNALLAEVFTDEGTGTMVAA